MDISDAEVEAAGAVIYAAGQFHSWGGFDAPWQHLDAIGKDKFLDIIERALRAAAKVRPGAKSKD